MFAVMATVILILLSLTAIKHLNKHIHTMFIICFLIKFLILEFHFHKYSFNILQMTVKF